jgi:uroporphyrinogen decarboxylase
MMTPKARVNEAFSFGRPDRVPLDYSANAGIDRKLKEHFGLAADDRDGLLEALGVDFRSAAPRCIGPPLVPPKPGRVITEWGAHKRWVEHETGGYWDYCDWPLSEATLGEIEAWPLPSPDDYGYEEALDRARAYRDYYVVIGGAGIGDIVNSTGMVRTMEQVLVDMATGAPESEAYYGRKCRIQLEVTERMLEKGKGLIDMLWIGEDLGTQIGPLMSLDLYRERIRPYQQRFVDLAKSYNVPVMIHSCGSSSWAFDDFVEMGISAVDTLQPEAANMAPEYLKERWGGRLCFHGMISTAGPVACGTVEDVRANVRETLAIMMPGGGYACAPTHALQDNSPLENVLAMYDEAQRSGRY